jgi:hypothetical protein
VPPFSRRAVLVEPAISPSWRRKMRHVSRFAVIGCLVVGCQLLLAGRASAQSVTFNFADNTSDGWNNGGFSSSPASTVVTIGGANYISLPIGGFQVANVATGNTGSAFFQAMAAATANPSGYTLSYNWYVDTSTFTGATSNSFLQLGSFVNTGSGFYAQDFGATKEAQLSGAQLTSGNTFQGFASVNMGAVGFTPPSGQTFYRIGLIENGDSGVPYKVEFTNISISPVPEPVSLGLLCFLPALAMRARRRM